MDLQQFSDLWPLFICIMRYGGALTALVLGVLTVLQLCCMVDHWCWTHRILGDDVFRLVVLFGYAIVGVIFFIASFYHP